MLFKSEREACEQWVGEMERIPQSIVEKLLELNEEELVEVTLPAKYDRIYVYDENKEAEIAQTCVNGDEDLYLVHYDDGTEDVIEAGSFEVIRDSYLPMWGTMWAFGDSIDNDWLSCEFGTDGLRLMSECGFRIYEQEDYGYIFGIDGAGYDFYEEHWLPLYRARGLKWHSTEDRPIEASSVEYNKDGSVTVCGNGTELRISTSKAFMLYYDIENTFYEEDVLNELENREELGRSRVLNGCSAEEIAYCREHIDELIDLYKDIRENSEDWYNCLSVAFQELLSQKKYNEADGHDEA